MSNDDDPQLPDVPSSSEEVTAPADARGAERLPEKREPAGGLAAYEPRTAPHASRFQFLFGALAAVALAAVAVAGIAVAGGGMGRDDTRLGSWSTWAPSDDSIKDGAQEIAEHVAPRYKQAGAQLVAVSGGELTYTDPRDGSAVPMKVAVRKPATAGGAIVFPKGDGVLYRLCGLGDNCSFDKGKPTVGRRMLLDREALELALYSFRYLDDVDQVVVFLPPVRIVRNGKAVAGVFQPQALHFEREDLEPLLDRPLSETVGPRVPTISTIEKSTEAARVQAIAAPNRFGMKLEPANGEAQIFVVLEPLDEVTPATPPSTSQG